ncbi:Methyltransferase domain-containing protein [Ruegeria intermedia]|uniref:Methyltransferase domain-containing protein n=1 Tax=Ruegeria intermedia TaxID=996115 RepID=A0A1M4ZT69_9RHOB|nr:class I SAM-dependent methyltransferase [Ruegeria intermedia]SHF21198.1 Methyltransferase domain-containing protein [Ruegeria intermedia]
MTADRKTHWDTVYGAKSEDQLSWHQDDPEVSLDLIGLAGVTAKSSVIDIGGGTSRLAGALLEKGLRDVTVLDLSPVSLQAARDRLGPAGDAVTWIATDITQWTPDRRYDLWHDRAVFHFLVDPTDRAAYLDTLAQAVVAGGHAIIATFAPDGPETCSGLPVARYESGQISEMLGNGFALVADRRHGHHTPWGAIQSFQYSLFRRLG